MKKRVYSIVFAALCGLCLAGLLAIWAMERSGIYLWLGGVATPGVRHNLCIVLTLLVFAWVMTLLWRGIHSKVAKVLLCPVAAVVLVAALYLQMLGHAWEHGGEKYRVYTSPDGAHTVVVMDDADFHLVYGDVYQVTSAITMERIGTWDGEIGSTYTVSWKEGRVIIECDGKKFTCYLKE
jgi:hypothetical protein